MARSTGCGTSTICAAVLVVRSFNDMGLTCFEPRGAFYASPASRAPA